MGKFKQLLWPRDSRGTGRIADPEIPDSEQDLASEGALRAVANRYTALLSASSVVGVGCFLLIVENAEVGGLRAWLTAGLLSVMIVPALAAALIGLPRRVAVVRTFTNRPDSEHEQVIIRVVIPALILTYSAGAAWWTGFPEAIVHVAVIGAFTVCISWIFLIHTMIWPEPSITRRVLGVFADLLPLTMALAAGGELLAVLYPTYLWIMFGYGFRFGVGFLALASIVGTASFAVVVTVNPFWHRHLLLSCALLLALVVLPTYVSTLIRKLNRAKSQAEEANRSKGRFLATMSHELRTPLTAIIGMSGLLKSTKIGKEQFAMVATIDTSAQSLLSQINEILDFSRIEAGKLVLENTSFDLHAVLGRVWTMLHGQAEQKGLKLRMTVDPRLPFMLRGDAQRLTQILVNLVGNAIKFTSQGEIVVAVHLHGAERGETLYRFEVSDTGIGIPADKQAEIFEGFSQADDSISRRFGGTGLGLAISKQLVELMGGQIGVQSAMGVGSVFTLKTPFEILDDTGQQSIDPSTLSVMLIGSDPDVVERLFLWLSGLSINPMIVEHVETLSTILSDRSAMAGTIAVVNDRADDPLVAAFSDRIGEGETGDMPFIVEVCRPASWIEKMAEWPVSLAISAPEEEQALNNALHAAFSILAPWSVVDDPSGRQTAAANWDKSTVESGPVRQGRRVLLAEDNSTNRLVISRMLEIAGYDVVAAADGDEALDLLAGGEFDIALMDVNMPGTSGLDVVRLHRLSEVNGRHLPIVALTADATVEARQRCEDAGMDDYLTKPVEPNQLFSVIDHLTPNPTKSPKAEPAEDETVTPISRHPRYQTIVDPVIDIGALDALRILDIDSTFLAEVLTEFLTDSKSIISEIESAWRDNDVARFRDAAHSLRSSANHVGAKRVVSHMLALRDIEREELAEKGEDAVRTLQDEFAEVESVLNKELRGIQKSQRSP
ncbi:MAG: response regulator [Inquilinus sp.]|nr:response regulator [Inquilinus sp.]